MEKYSTHNSVSLKLITQEIKYLIKANCHSRNSLAASSSQLTFLSQSFRLYAILTTWQIKPIFVFRIFFFWRNWTRLTVTCKLVPLDYTSQYLILSNLSCKLYFLFLLAKRPRKVNNFFNISRSE